MSLNIYNCAAKREPTLHKSNYATTKLGTLTQGMAMQVHGQQSFLENILSVLLREVVGTGETVVGAPIIKEAVPHEVPCIDTLPSDRHFSFAKFYLQLKNIDSNSSTGGLQFIIKTNDQEKQCMSIVDLLRGVELDNVVIDDIVNKNEMDNLENLTAVLESIEDEKWVRSYKSIPVGLIWLAGTAGVYKRFTSADESDREYFEMVHGDIKFCKVVEDNKNYYVILANDQKNRSETPSDKRPVLPINIVYLLWDILQGPQNTVDPDCHLVWMQNGNIGVCDSLRLVREVSLSDNLKNERENIISKSPLELLKMIDKTRGLNDFEDQKGANFTDVTSVVLKWIAKHGDLNFASHLYDDMFDERSGHDRLFPNTLCVVEVDGERVLRFAFDTESSGCLKVFKMNNCSPMFENDVDCYVVQFNPVDAYDENDGYGPSSSNPKVFYLCKDFFLLDKYFQQWKSNGGAKE